MPANAGDWFFLEIPGLQEGNGNPLQYSCLANLWAEEPGGCSPWGHQRVGCDLATKQQRQWLELGAAFCIRSWLSGTDQEKYMFLFPRRGYFPGGITLIP